MLTNIAISKDRKEATLYFDCRPNFNLYCSEGRVLDLLVIFLKPVKATNESFTWSQYISSNEDTQIINMGALNDKV